MAFNEIKDWISSLFEKLSKPELLEVVAVFKNKIEDQEQEIKKSKDEINKLKGEKGVPDIKPNKPKDDQLNAGTDPTSPPKKKGKKNRKKKDFLTVQRKLKLSKE